MLGQKLMQRMEAATVETGHVTSGGAELYYERRGEGPAVLLIAGGLADAGQFTALGTALEDRHTVVSYDRRGNSRSSVPEGWATTTVHEQADDAAAVLDCLGIAAAMVYGHSIGVPIALDLALRRPEALQGIVAHDPAMMALLADPDAAMGVLGPVIGAAMEAGGPIAAADAFFRFAVGSALDTLDPATWERMKLNGAVLFGSEFEPISAWKPDEDALRRMKVPMRVLAGTESPPFFLEAGEWLAARTGAELVRVPGGHGSPFDHAADVAAEVARFLEETAQ
jgi:pimeloyl-ACP methyl ester carboxylesterase